MHSLVLFLSSKPVAKHTGRAPLHSATATALVDALGQASSQIRVSRALKRGPFYNNGKTQLIVFASFLPKIGDGGNCWTGQKQLCECCGPNIPDQGPCVPRISDTSCVLGVLICHNLETTEPRKVCSSYACGVCGNPFGFLSSGKSSRSKSDEL